MTFLNLYSHLYSCKTIFVLKLLSFLNTLPKVKHIPVLESIIFFNIPCLSYLNKPPVHCSQNILCCSLSPLSLFPYLNYIFSPKLILIQYIFNSPLHPALKLSSNMSIIFPKEQKDKLYEAASSIS